MMKLYTEITGVSASSVSHETMLNEDGSYRSILDGPRTVLEGKVIELELGDVFVDSNVKTRDLLGKEIVIELGEDAE